MNRVPSQAQPDPWSELRAYTPARIALGRVGDSLPTAAHLDFQLAHARARDAVHETLDLAGFIGAVEAAGLQTVHVRSAAPDRATYLLRPDLGRRLDPESRARLRAQSGVGRDAVLVLADGLAARAATRHGPPLLSLLVPRLEAAGWQVGPVVVAEQARVALGDEIGEALGARLVAILLGERPGLSAPDSLGAYLTWDPRPGRTDAQRNCVSNIRPEGLGYPAAAGKLIWLMTEARARRVTGVNLKDDTGALGT